MPDIDTLKHIKDLSDRGHYDAKARILRELMKANPDEWEIDENEQPHPGVRHIPTGFQYHLPQRHITGTPSMTESEKNASGKMGSGILFLCDGGKVLFEKNHPEKGQDNVGKLRPAGGGESKKDNNLRETIIREVYEEFGLDPEYVDRRLLLLGFQKDGDYKDCAMFALSDHGLTEGQYEATNAKDEYVDLVEATMDDADYIGPQLDDLREPVSDREKECLGPVTASCWHITCARDDSRSAATVQAALEAVDAVETQRYRSGRFDVDVIISHSDEARFKRATKGAEYSMEITEPTSVHVQRLNFGLDKSMELSFNKKDTDPAEIRTELTIKLAAKNTHPARMLPDGSVVDVEKLHERTKGKRSRTLSIDTMTGLSSSPRDGFSYRSMETIEDKYAPILVAPHLDNYVIDGKHRVLRHKLSGRRRLPVYHMTQDDIDYAKTTSEHFAKRSYVIQDGDTVGGIARRFGISEFDIFDANPGLDEYTLQSGGEIQVPGSGGGGMVPVRESRPPASESPLDPGPTPESGGRPGSVGLIDETVGQGYQSQAANLPSPTGQTDEAGAAWFDMPPNPEWEAPQVAHWNAMRDHMQRYHPGDLQPSNHPRYGPYTITPSRGAIGHVAGIPEAVQELPRATTWEELQTQSNALIRRLENFSERSYDDREHRSIGFGSQLRNNGDGINDRFARDVLGIDPRDLYAGRASLTEQQALAMKENYWQQIQGDIERLVPNINELPPEFQHVVRDIAYSSGTEGLARYVEMRKALDRHDYQRALLEYWDSKKIRDRTSKNMRAHDRAALNLTLMRNRLRQLQMQKEGSVKVAEELEVIDPANTGPEAIYRRLAEIDLDTMENEARELIASGKKTKREKGIKMLNAISGLKRNEINPSELMITRVPVLPTRFRPFITMGDTFIPGDANELYRDLIYMNDGYREARETLGDDGVRDMNPILYNYVKALYGYGDSPSPKTREAGVSGYLQKILGSSPKESFFQRKMISKTQDTVGRSVISIDPDMNIDQVGIPWDIAWKMYGPYVERRLVKKRGMSPADAIKAVRDRTETAKRELIREADPADGGRPVVYSRAPAWHRQSVLAGWPKFVESDSIFVNPFVTDGLNADFDGDQCLNQILACIPEEYVAELGTAYKNLHHHEIKFSEIARIPAYQNGRYFIFDLEDFPKLGLQHTKEGKNGRIDFHFVPEGIKVLSYDETTGGLTWADVAFWSKHYDREIEIIDLHNGYQIISDDDPRAVYGTPAGRLGMERFRPDDALQRKVLVPRARHVPVQHAVIKHVDVPNVSSMGGVPVLKSKLELTASVGWFLGCMVGDGWVTKMKGDPVRAKQFNMSDDEGFNITKFKQIIPEFFDGPGPDTSTRGVSMTSDTPGRLGNTVSYRFSSVNLATWLRGLIGGERDETTSGSANKHLPPFYLSASREFREGLFAGLIDTDGSISSSGGKRNPQLMSSYGTTSIRLAIEVKLLAASLGVASRITPYKTPLGKAAWMVTFSAPDLQKQWNGRYLANERKKQVIVGSTRITDSAVTAKYDVVPVSKHLANSIAQAIGCPKITKQDRAKLSSGLEEKKKTQALYMTFAQARNENHTKYGAVSRQSAKFAVELLGEETITRMPDGKVWLSMVKNTDVTWERVVGVQKTGIRETGYDLTVPGYETFMSADGVILSNTMNTKVPSGRDAIEEARERLMPSKMLFSIRDPDRVIPGPKQEQILGIASAYQRPAKQQHTFNNVDDALQALQSGDVSVADEINIPGLTDIQTPQL